MSRLLSVSTHLHPSFSAQAFPTLPSAAHLKFKDAKRFHAHVITTGLHQQELHLRKLITLFATPNNPSSLAHAHLLFNQIQSPSIFIYNTLFRAYASTSHPLRALCLFRRMLRHAAPSPDSYTFPFLSKACSALQDLPLGRQLHSQAFKHGFGSNVFVLNSLIHLYGSNSELATANRIFDEMGSVRDTATWTTMISCCAQFSSVEAARHLFDRMPMRTIVSYSAMIAGYVLKNRFSEALGLFHELLKAKLEPSDRVITSALCACANLGVLDMGTWIHSYIRKKKGDRYDSRIASALIDMYFKCGSVNTALNVFDSTKEKSVGEWTSLLSGLAIHGLGRKVIEAFEDMVKSGVIPNAVTFVALLSGCTHSGLVNEGLGYFYSMKTDYGIDPAVEHYGCVVDLLSRAGLINQAVSFIQQMPLEANAAIWGAVLNACRVHKNVEVGEIAANWLISDEPWNAAIYITLLGLYKDAGKWNEMEKLKAEMKKDGGCRKSPGCTLLEVNGYCFEFVAGDKSHPSAFEMCTKISQLISDYFKEDILADDPVRFVQGS